MENTGLWFFTKEYEENEYPDVPEAGILWSEIGYEGQYSCVIGWTIEDCITTAGKWIFQITAIICDTIDDNLEATLIEGLLDTYFPDGSPWVTGGAFVYTEADYDTEAEFIAIGQDETCDGWEEYSYAGTNCPGMDCCEEEEI